MSINDIYSIFRRFPRISTDSRNIQAGSIFFALKGENFNGNKFAEQALKKGAEYAVVDEAQYAPTNKSILVENVLQTLKDLANLHRRTLALPVLAITGSNGKTTTKELIAAVLAQKYKVGFTQGNLNNHIGVPLTLLSMNGQTQLGVVEMGANHPGEIAALCSIAQPDYGIITNIGKAHLEGFGSFEAVKQTKAELYDYLQTNDGTVFYDADNSILTDLTRQLTRKYSYGTTHADFTAEVLQSPPFVNLKANFSKGALYINTRLIGEYNAQNVMAAMCIGLYFGVDPLKIQSAIGRYQPRNNRSQLIKKNGLKIILDAYNANPTSMLAALNSLLMRNPSHSTVILGDMLELGKYAREEHIAIMELLKNYPDTQVFVVGTNFAKIASAYSCNSFENVDQLCSYLQQNEIRGNEVLIKGSRGIQLEKVLNCFN